MVSASFILITTKCWLKLGTITTHITVKNLSLVTRYINTDSISLSKFIIRIGSDQGGQWKMMDVFFDQMTTFSCGAFLPIGFPPYFPKADICKQQFLRWILSGAMTRNWNWQEVYLISWGRMAINLWRVDKVLGYSSAWRVYKATHSETLWGLLTLSQHNIVLKY